MKRIDLRSMKSGGMVNSSVSEGIDPKAVGQAQNLLTQYQGRSQDELLEEVRAVAARQKAAGNLSNEKMDTIAGALAPMMSEDQRKILENLMQQLKGG